VSDLFPEVSVSDLFPEVSARRGGIRYDMTPPTPEQAAYADLIHEYTLARLRRVDAAVDHALVEALVLGLDVRLHRPWNHAGWVGIELAERPPGQEPRVMPRLHEYTSDYDVWDEDE